MPTEKLPTLTFNLHQQLTSARQHVCLCLCIQHESESTRGPVWLWRSNGITSATDTVCPWLPRCDMNMEEEEQKAQWHRDKVIGVDRCVCEKLHLCVSSLCQNSRWPVAGHQWPSLIPPSTPLSLSISPQSQSPCSSHQTMPRTHLDEDEHRHRCRWFIHKAVWEAV